MAGFGGSYQVLRILTWRLSLNGRLSLCGYRERTPARSNQLLFRFMHNIA